MKNRRVGLIWYTYIVHRTYINSHWFINPESSCSFLFLYLLILISFSEQRHLERERETESRETATTKRMRRILGFLSKNRILNKSHFFFFCLLYSFGDYLGHFKLYFRPLRSEQQPCHALIGYRICNMHVLFFGTNQSMQRKE